MFSFGVDQTRLEVFHSVTSYGSGAACAAAVRDLSSIPDEELMLMLQLAGETARANEIFAELFRRYQARVTAWCSRLIRDPARGMDLAQEVFLKAWRHRHTFRGDSRISTWLYAIARNHCLNAIRKLEADPLARLETFPPDLQDTFFDIHAAAEHAQAFDRLWAILDRTLTATEKRVMALHFAHGLTLDVITRSCGFSNPSGAKAYIVNARRKLKRALSDRAVYEKPSKILHSRAA